MLFKRNNRKKVGIREKTALFVSQRQDGNSQTFSQRDEPVAKPPISEVHKAIEILEKFILFSRSGEDLMSSLKVVNRVIHAEEQLSKKQSTINAYFRKEKLSEICRTYLYFCTPTPKPLLWLVIPVSVAKILQK